MSNYVIERENSDGTISLSISSHPFNDDVGSHEGSQELRQGDVRHWRRV